MRRRRNQDDQALIVDPLVSWHRAGLLGYTYIYIQTHTHVPHTRTRVEYNIQCWDVVDSNPRVRDRVPNQNKSAICRAFVRAFVRASMHAGDSHPTHEDTDEKREPENQKRVRRKKEAYKCRVMRKKCGMMGEYTCRGTSMNQSGMSIVPSSCVFVEFHHPRHTYVPHCSVPKFDPPPVGLVHY